jgi:hypothetical protein
VHHHARELGSTGKVSHDLEERTKTGEAVEMGRGPV